jgi:type I restriction enzyme S subunit
MIRAQDYSQGWVDLEDLYRVSLAIDRAYERSKVITGDVLLTIVGSVGNLAKVPRAFDGSNITQQTARLSFDPKVADADYYFNVLQSHVGKKAVSNYTKSGVQPSLNLSDVEKFMLPVPPLCEQRVISTALSDVDALLDMLERLIAKKRDLKQAAMQQLLTGQTRLPGFTDEWEVKRLGSVVDTDPESLSSDIAPDLAFSYIALEDVDRGILRGHAELIFANAPSRARRKLRPNDVLVSTVRPELQSHLLFTGDTNIWVCSTGFCVVRCRERVTCPRFIFCHLFAGSVRRQIQALLTGSNYPAISTADVRALEIPFPAYDEQLAIADVLMDMDAELAALEQRLDKTRKIKQAMMQELLTGRTRLVSAEAPHA